ncbi:MAG: hypothetical protein HFH84_00085 [Lachnospiraceae bacterium]|nr:hypothetical protein [Lachnospiraceae bacterium]
MKKISLERLLQESGEDAYPQQYRYICGRIEAGELIPVKKSPLNGKKPALHLSYWLAEEAPDYGEETEELKFRMAPAIRTDYYLKHLKTYREEAAWVRMLNRYFLEQEERKDVGSGGVVFVSLNERSFQIWGREKFLQREQGRKILAHCGVELEQLHVYGTTEPLAYYSCIRSAPQTVLILENKDTFYSMRRYLNGDCRKDSEVIPRRIFGREIGTVIYGAGKGILRSFEDFRFCVESHVNAPENEILYFGDLDYEGIGIYERLAELFGAGENGCEIKPFTQAYEKMLEKAAQGVDFLPETSENQNRNLSGLFFSYFTESLKARMEQILEAGKYIPQESINITDF